MLAFFLVSDFVMFAQDDCPPDTPGCDNPTDDLEGDDTGSINAKMIYLAIVGIAFAFYLYNRKKQEQLEN